MGPILDRRDWLPELAAALKAIADALGDEELTPERLVEIQPLIATVIPEHTVQVCWVERGNLNDPEIDEPGEPGYVITISGDRIKAGWFVAATDLPRVLRLAVST